MTHVGRCVQRSIADYSHYILVARQQNTIGVLVRKDETIVKVSITRYIHAWSRHMTEIEENQNLKAGFHD